MITYFQPSRVISRRRASAFLGVVLTLSVAAPNCAVAQDSAPEARTPPMGWNSWNHFAEKVTDADVRAAADALVASGMRDAGYVYVNIDDSWEGDRDAGGNIQSNKKFPDMKALADYVHSKGLKIGIYSSPGPKTCAGYEGSYNHEEQDAKSYAGWGFDYLKYDQCSFGDTIRQEAGDDLVKASAMQRAAYEKMHQALQHTHHPVVYSFCQYGLYAVWRWGAESGANLWRTTGDIKDNWSQMSLIGFQQAGLEKFAGPGHWNDPDMLEVGNGHMSTIEYQTHMSLWAILAAPLLAGNDLSAMTEDTRSILLNKDVIAIDQDRLGRAGYRVWAEGPLEIWERQLENGHKAIALFNRGESPMSFPVDAATLGIKSGAEFTDVWQKKTTVLKNGSEPLVLNHGVTLLRSR
ncbi:alpha-galactosidase [Edaphobacter modestus]|uniref:Alpha-galactosidase n=2 Tax=Edaphobacter modestus TaxID=388466 RepID=A0A4Q7Z216_9BACT|nr:alpha-galactosidase [Edaphobacter modestus]